MTDRGHRPLNRRELGGLLLAAMYIERSLIQRGINLPAGGSRLVIAQKI